MIYVHSLGRASRYYPGRTALIEGENRTSFLELHARVAALAGELVGHGFEAGDRLALLLPNSQTYIELVYACAWLGVIAVPLNVRLSQAEIDRVLVDANPRGLVRHSSLPPPSVPLKWHRVIDQAALGRPNRSSSQHLLRPGSNPGSHLYQRHHRPTQRRCGDSRQYPGQRSPLQLLDDLQRRWSVLALRADLSYRRLPFYFCRAGFRCVPDHPS